MNVNFQTINGMESDLEKTRKSTEAGLVFSGKGNRSKSVQGAAVVDLNGSMRSDMFFGDENTRTKSDIISEAQNTDTELRHNYMSLMANNMSAEDFAKASEEGFDISHMDAEATVTILDRIKAEVAKSGKEIVGYNDDLSRSELVKITGSEGLAGSIERAFNENDIPLTENNVRETVAVTKQMEDITALSEGAVKFMTENQLDPSMENIYLAMHATNGQNRTGGRYYAEELGGYYAQKADSVQWEQIEDQAKRIISEAGLDSDDNIVIDRARWMVEEAIPLTTDNLIKVNELYEIKLPMSEDDIAESAAKAIANKNPAAAGMTEKPENNYKKAAFIDERTRTISDDAVIKVVKDKEEPTLQNLFAAEGELNDLPDKEQVRTDIRKFGESTELLTARKQLEEVRLSMSVSANYRLIDKGFSIDTAPMQELIDELNLAVKEMGQSLFGEEAPAEKFRLFEETITRTSEFMSMPLAVIGRHDPEIKESLGDIYDDALSLKRRYDKAGATYEAVGTAPRADMGDSIKKAFRNVDDILQDLGQNLNEENRRVVRILGYNRMEITEENIERVRTMDEKLMRTVDKLKPSAVLNMIRDGHNPLKMTLDELSSELSDQDKDSQAQEEKYSKFLYKLEKNAEISPEERETFIGIYRLFSNLKRTDNAAIGAVLEMGSEMTVENLISATRTLKTEKRGMDYRVDDSFGGLEQGARITPSISAQIETAFLYYSGKADTVYDNLEPEKLHNAGASYESLLDELADKLAEEELSEETLKADRSYKEESSSRIRQMAARPDAEGISGELTEYAIETSIDNIEALLGLRAARKGRNSGSLWNQAEKIAHRIFKETEQDMLTDLIDADDYKESYEDHMTELSNELDAMLHEQTDTYIDVKSIQLMKKQINVAVRMADRGSFEIPVEVDGRTVSMHVTLRESDTEGAKISAELETMDYGHISMAMTVTDGFVKGAFAAAYTHSEELAEYMDDVKKRFVSGFEDVGTGLQIRSEDINIMYRRVNADDAVMGSEKGFFDNRTLLRMAEIFVHSV